jgi:hypothetical protein
MALAFALLVLSAVLVAHARRDSVADHAMCAEYAGGTACAAQAESPQPGSTPFTRPLQTGLTATGLPTTLFTTIGHDISANLATDVSSPAVVATNTFTASPTPADIVLDYSCLVGRRAVTIDWHSAYTGSVEIDGTPAPGNGRRAYPLATHTYLSVATSLDGTQRRIAPIVVDLARCMITVNGRATRLATATCRGGPALSTATPTESVILMPLGFPTATPSSAVALSTPSASSTHR